MNSQGVELNFFENNPLFDVPANPKWILLAIPPGGTHLKH
jgi:hypothetical protein